MTDAYIIAQLRAQLDATLKDRALIIAQRDEWHETGERLQAEVLDRNSQIVRLCEQSTRRLAALIAAEARADAMEAEAHAHIKMWGDALRQRDAAEARADAAVKVKPHEIERLVFAAMVWGASQPQRKNGAAFPNYHDRGNSNAEVEARAIAARIRSAIGGVE